MEIIKITPKDLGKLDITDYCRKLIKEGKDVNSRLELYRERDTPDVIVSNIGKTAKWKIIKDKFVEMPVKAPRRPVH